MNGRAYDYNLGRFLSVDPFVQAPGNSQSMNPYSYIMNNPLSGTDPSGYKSICGTEGKRACDGVIDYTGNNGHIKVFGSKNNGKSTKQSTSSPSGEETKIETTGSKVQQSNVQQAAQGNQQGSQQTPQQANQQSTSGGTPPANYTPTNVSLPAGTTYSSLTNDQKIMLIRLDTVIGHYKSELQSYTGSDSDILAKSNINQVSFVYSTNRVQFTDSNGNTFTELALASASRAVNNGQLVNGSNPNFTVTFNGILMSDFATQVPLSQSEINAGYHVPVRAGLNGVFDLLTHEHAHMFSFDSSYSNFQSNRAQWDFDFEKRADDFLLKARANSPTY